jgi:Ribonuclease HepT-like
MAGAGNIYRHDYEDVAAQQVWDTVQIDLPPLRAAIAQELAALDPPPEDRSERGFRDHSPEPLALAEAEGEAISTRKEPAAIRLTEI